MGPGMACFDPWPWAQALCVGLASVSGGMIYGGMLSFAEGRGGTEVVIATLNLSLVLANGSARGLSVGLSVGSMRGGRRI